MQTFLFLVHFACDHDTLPWALFIVFTLLSAGMPHVLELECDLMPKITYSGTKDGYKGLKVIVQRSALNANKFDEVCLLFVVYFQRSVLWIFKLIYPNMRFVGEKRHPWAACGAAGHLLRLCSPTRRHSHSEFAKLWTRCEEWIG